MLKASDLFEIQEGFPFIEYFLPEASPWEWVNKIKEALLGFDFSKSKKTIEPPPGVEIGEKVFIHPSVILPHYAVIKGPAYIGQGTQIRPGAYIRENVIIGEGCIIGNACEYKNCLLLNKVETPHYNYVGDSIIGNKGHMGAGSILANLKFDQQPVNITLPSGKSVSTGMRKLGALIGDGAQVGCNAVLQPGTILGKGSMVMPTLAFKGYLPAKALARSCSYVNIQSL